MCRANHVLAQTCYASMSTLLFLWLVTTGASQILSTITLIVQSSTDSVPFMANLLFAETIPEAVIIILIVFGYGGDFHESSKLSLDGLKRKALLIYNLKAKDQGYWKGALTKLPNWES